MKMHLKRIVSAVCALALCASVVSTPVLANETETGDSSNTTTTTTTELDGSAESNNENNGLTKQATPGENGPDGANVPVVMSYHGTETVKVGQTIHIEANSLGETGDLWFVDKEGYVTLSNETISSVDVTGVKAGTVVLTHKWVFESTEETYTIQIVPADPEVTTVTVAEVLTELNPQKSVDDYELDTEGNATGSTFSFTLTSAADSAFSVGLTATVTENGEKTVPITVSDAENNPVLPAGTYTIQETSVNEAVWSTDDAITFTVGDDGTVTCDDATINNTLNKYTVTYDDGVDADDPDPVTGLPTDSNTYRYNEKATVLADTPTRENYDFVGWSTDGQTANYKAGDPIQVTGAMTLTALWKAKETQQPGGSGSGTGSGTTGSTGSTDDVVVDKTAKALDENSQSTVTLEIGGAENKDKAVVLFLLDKSTSQGMRNEAVTMLNELKTKNNVDVLYDVVIFSGTATASGWNNIHDNTTFDEVVKNFANESTTSGTNMDAGIERAQAEMATLPAEYKDAPAYLVTLSDGITYVWSDDNEVKCVPIQGMNGDKVESRPQNAASTWAMMYKDGIGLQDIYGGTTISETIANFKDAIVPKMENTRSEGHVQVYLGANQYSNPISTYIYELDKKQEVAETYACGPDFAMYQSITGYEELLKNFDYSFAYAVPELNEDGITDNTDNWDTYYPWGKEIMLYMHSLSSDSASSGEVSNANAKEMFATIRNRMLYTIQSGTVTDVIGNDFDLAGLDSIQLTVGDGDPMKGTPDGNTIHFGNPDKNGTYPYDVTYYQKGTGADSREQLEWKINTPVESTAGLKLTYTLNLVNQSSKVGDHTVKTNEEATLEYTSTTGGTGSEEFPVPEVTYHVAKLEPAEMTIYMGGDKGYTGVVDDKGTIVSNNSLPQPGFYISLPEAVNEALQKANIGTSNEPVNLSDYIKIYTTDQTDSREWTLASYGASYSAAYGKYIYAVVPASNDTEDIFRLNFTDAAGNTYSSDTFDPAKNGNLSQTYTMSVYPELVKQHQVIIEVKISENETYRCTMVTGTADLNVRYVTDGEVTTSVSTDIAQTSANEDPNQTALHNAYVVKDPDTKFFINGSQVDVNENGFANVSLLFDDIVSDENTAAASDYETALKDTALEKIGTTLQNVQYQAKYLDLVDANNGNVWLTPSKDVTVYWPYPEGTNANTKFYLVHFKGLNREISLDNVFSSIDSAETEVMELSTDGYGISFKTDSFSPYVLLWDNAKEQPAPSTDKGDDNDNTTSNNNTTTVNVTTNNNATAPAQPQAVAAIPQTGDSMPVGLLGGVAAVAAIAFAALAVIRKRKKD